MISVPIVSSISGAKSTVVANDPVITSSRIIWQDRIDTAPNGQLTQASGQRLFDPTYYLVPAEHAPRGTVVDDAPNGKLLRHNLPPRTLGNFTVSPIIGTPTEYGAIEYKIRFDSNFDWRWGGKMGPAFVGVVPGHGIYEPTSGNSNRDVGFSTRSMWGGEVDANGVSIGTTGSVKLYLYLRWPRDASPYPGWQSYGWQPDLNITLRRGVWYKIRTVVRLNTVGKHDGLFESWLDDVLMFRMTNVDYRMDPRVKIQCVLWDIHRGGDLNGFWTSPRSSDIDIKDVTVWELSGPPVNRLLSDGFSAGVRSTIHGTTLDNISGGTITGQAWSADNNIGIVEFIDVLNASHLLCYPAVSAGYKQASVNVERADHYAEVFIDTPHGAPVYVTGRGVDALNCCRVYANANGSLAIGKLINGNPSELWVGPSGQVKRQNFLGINCVGDKITAYLNGLPVRTVPDPSPSTAGNRCGIAFGGGSTTGRLTNFQATFPI